MPCEVNGTDKKTQLESGFEPVTHLMTQATVGAEAYNV